MDDMALGIGLAWYLVFVFSTVLHEASHALVAWWLGDPTAYQGGQVSLNPAWHIQREPFGMVVLPILSYVLGGWMFGWASAPYDPLWARQYPKRVGLMTMAGPLSNLVLVLLAGAAIRIGVAMGYFHAPETIRGISQITVANGPGLVQAMSYVLSIMFGLNLILFIFNLLPLPPLDGSGIIPMFLDANNANRYDAMIHHPTFSIFGFLIAWQLMDVIYRPIHIKALNLLYPGVFYG